MTHVRYLLAIVAIWCVVIIALVYFVYEQVRWSLGKLFERSKRSRHSK